MHNRTRMCVAFYLTKHLRIHWKWGEWWFATRLIDYDPAINNGNWQWCASTGIDPIQYGKPRMFNFDSQTKKTDPQHIYIDEWLGDRTKLPVIVDFEKSRDDFLVLWQKYIQK